MPTEPASVGPQSSKYTSFVREFSSSPVAAVLFEEYVEMEAMEPYAVRRDGNAVCLPDVMALPDGQLR